MEDSMWITLNRRQNLSRPVWILTDFNVNIKRITSMNQDLLKLLPAVIGIEQSVKEVPGMLYRGDLPLSAGWFFPVRYSVV
jgi:hypothetical protein